MRLAGGRRVVGVVKADAYGHGAAPVARALVAAGCPALATWSVEEAALLRDAGIRVPLLVFRGVLDAEDAAEAVARDLTCALHDVEGLGRLAEAARRRGAGPAAVHVEVDTGMRRMGVAPAEAVDLLVRAAGEPGVRLEGVMTHLARADEPDLEPSRAQLRELGRILAAARAQGVTPGCVHAANSAGLVVLAALEDAGPAQDAVRPGLLLYGAQPLAESGTMAGGGPEGPGRRVALRPVMTVEAPVVAVRRVRRGEAVGYAARYRAGRDTRVATLGMGYADGIPIAATGRGGAWIAGRRVPFAGRVSMDSVGLEVGDLPVRVGDRAVLFGAEAPGKPAVLSVDEAAEAAGTLAYELLVRIGARVRRAYVGGDAG